MAIIKNKVYFFLTPSVFEAHVKNPSSNASKFLLKSVLIKLRHRKQIDPHIVFYLFDEIENLKIEFGDHFNSVLELGENMFCPEVNPEIRGNIKERILYYATDKDGEILETDRVKVVCADADSFNYFESQVSYHKYPVEVIRIDDALVDMERIEKELNEGNCYPSNGEQKD